MSSTITNSLSKEKMQQLLVAVGKTAIEDTSETNAVEHDWRQPRYFDISQLQIIDNYTKELAKAIKIKFDALYNSSFEITITSTNQIFANNLLGEVQDNGGNDYYLAFGCNQDQQVQTQENNHQCGIVHIPEQSAIEYLTQLLGDSNSGEEEDSAKEFSQLEESLLTDITSAFVEGICESQDICDFYKIGIIKGQLPFEPADTEILLKITLNIKKPEAENGSQAHILILSGMLETIITDNAQTDKELSAQDTSKLILTHVEQMPVSITVQLDEIMLTVEQIIGLDADDILLLGKEINDPIKLLVDKKTFFRGWPAKSGGNYSVVVTETVSNTQ